MALCQMHTKLFSSKLIVYIITHRHSKIYNVNHTNVGPERESNTPPAAQKAELSEARDM